MYLKELRIEGFKSFGKSAVLTFPSRITGIVGPNGSGKSNVAEAFRFVLGEQSMKSMRGKRGEDLIFNGGSGAGRASRAMVSIVFDNSSYLLNSKFSEVSVSRTVYQNGMNEYAINNTQVRHRDVVELLAKANFGSTGHHIISQGEADRILHASNEERKEMFEDGLGLKLLQYRRAESEKKLQRAQANIAETDLILREITPHLRYLKRQVEYYEKARKTREDLVTLYAKYLAYEIKCLAVTRCDLEGSFDVLKEKLTSVEKKVAQERKNSKVSYTPEEYSAEEKVLTEKVRSIQDKKDVTSREIGRLEGECTAFETITQNTDERLVDKKVLSDLYEDIKNRHREAGNASVTLITYILRRLREILIGDRNHIARNIGKTAGRIAARTGKNAKADCCIKEAGRGVTLCIGNAASNQRKRDDGCPPVRKNPFVTSYGKKYHRAESVRSAVCTIHPSGR